MPLTQEIIFPYNGGVKAFLPLHLAELFHPNQSLLRFNTSTRDFELACQAAEDGQFAILRGSYQTLLNESLQEIEGNLGKLKYLAQLSHRVAVLCHADRAIELNGAPPVIGADKLFIIPPNWYYRYYLLSVGKLSDLQLRYLYATQGLEVPLLRLPLIVNMGVFVPDLSLMHTFLDVTSLLQSKGINDFSNKIVCDTFSGSGVFGLLGGFLGARLVHFVDIDALASECVSTNIRRFRPRFYTSVHVADIFPEHLRAETIIANPPWKDVHRRREMGLQFQDPDRVILRRFFFRLRKHLQPKGVVYLFYEKAGKQQVYDLAHNFSIEEFPVKVLGTPRLLFRLQS